MKKLKFTTTMDAELLKRIKIRAIEENTSVSNILESLIEKYLSTQSSKSLDSHFEH